MTTFTQGDKSVSVSYGEMHTEVDTSIKDVKYIVTAPKIECNDELDAQYIKDRVNSFVNNLVKSLLNGERI